MAREIEAFVECPELRVRPYFRDQLARSAHSIAANIAEGLGRATPLDTASFLDRARGSLFETDYWIGVLKARGLVDSSTHAGWEQELGELNAMLMAVKKRLHERSDAARPRARSRQGQ